MLLLEEGYDGAQDTGLYPYMQVLKGAMKPIMELPFFYWVLRRQTSLCSQEAHSWSELEK